jgi:hypothetical protein
MNRLMATWLCLAFALASNVAAETAGPPVGVYYWEPGQMAAVKALLADNGSDEASEEVRRAVEFVREEANDCLRRGPYAVTDNEALPPSGDTHDYVSYGPYWWPDPKKKDGLPFIRRDGRTNEDQRAKGDREALERMIEDVEALSLGYYFLGRKDYADHARQLVRTWFLDEETRMNPHLKFAQAIPGRDDGRWAGIIDARAMVELLDAIALLEHSEALTAEDQRGLRDWYVEYLKWLLTSDFGQGERDEDNNHGTWYLVQAARIALYIGDKEEARLLVESARPRLARTIQDDGSQQEELERTRSLHYSIFHLTGFMYLARFGESLGVDLWHDDGGKPSRIKLGLDFAVPFVLKQNEWQFEEIRDYKLSQQVVQVLRMAQARYGEPAYAEVLAKAKRSDRDRDFAPLLFAAKK